MPSFVSPSTGSPAAPPTGKFWRSYIFNYKEGSTPALRDDLAGVKTLWNCKKNSPEQNGALGRLGLWCNKIQAWGNTPSQRIPQPVWLYHQHAGTCSEHGWFANAAGRAALIPMALDEGARFDHKWNEFYERGWKDFEPINGWINRQANDYWEDPSKILNACFIWRGDGFIWGYTERYSPVCTLHVTVSDANGRPVDGAAVTIDCPGAPGPFCMMGWTTSAGFCSFLLADNIDYFSCAIQSSLGNKAAQNLITNSKAGICVSYAPKLSGALPQLKAEAVTISPDTGASQKIVYTINAATEIVYGKHTYSFGGYSVPCTFSDSRQSGKIDYFICDEENFAKYTNGNSFNAAVLKRDAIAIDSSFTFPSGKNWYAVLSNEGKAASSSVASITIQLLTKKSAAARRPAASSLSGIRLRKRVHGTAMVFSWLSPETAPAFLDLYDSRGRCVRSLSSHGESSGEYSIAWNCVDMPEGMYYYLLRASRQKTKGTIAIVH
jgi:hypothetical protein